MKKLVQNKVVEYGTNELKKHIRTSTRNAFLITNGLFIILFLAILSYSGVDDIKKYFAPFKDIQNVVMIPINPPTEEIEDVNESPEPIEPITPPNNPNEGDGGSEKKSGEFKGVEDNKYKDTVEVANFEETAHSTSKGGGTGKDPNQKLTPEPVVTFGNGKQNSPKPVDVPEDVFIPVEKQPSLDIVKLQKLVKYPELAKKVGIEGRVIIKVLVGIDGKVLKRRVEYTDNTLLNDEALKAIDNYGKLEPAKQNDQPVACWVSIPITFRLK